MIYKIELENFKSYFGTDERGFGYIRIKVKSIALCSSSNIPK